MEQIKNLADMASITVSSTQQYGCLTKAAATESLMNMP